MANKPKYIVEDYEDEILSWIAGGKTLRSYCRQAGKPSWQTVYRWLDKDEVLQRRFEHSRTLGFDAMAQQCLDIAENGNPNNLPRAKLRVWTTLQLLAKWDPRRYGDLRRLEHVNEQKQTVTIVTGVPQPKQLPPPTLLVEIPSAPLEDLASHDESDLKVRLPKDETNEEAN